MLVPGTRALMIRFGEIFLKSEPVKRQFLRMMEKNIRNALPEYGESLNIIITRGRILVYGPDLDDIIPRISHIFGIVDLSPALISGTSIGDFSLNAIKVAENHLKPGMRFAVRARRDGVDEYSSQVLAAEVGSALYTHIPDLSVDLTNPDYEIFVEARREGGIIYDSRIKGPGGLPYGTQGSVVTLLSAGIDSPVAAWLMMRRGVKILSVFIDGEEYGGRDVWANVLRNIKALSAWAPGHIFPLLRIPASTLYEQIMQIREPRFRCIICKRAMLMLAEKVAKTGEHNGIVLGDNLGQVATQTLKNLATISDGIVVPQYRPLIGYDKEEIINLARKIGSFSDSPGDTSCLVVPKKPATEADNKIIDTIVSELELSKIITDILMKHEKILIKDGELIDR